MPGEIEAVYMAKKMNAIKNALTLADVQGDTLSGNNQLSYYDGLLKIVDAGAPVNGNRNNFVQHTLYEVIRQIQLSLTVLIY